MIEIAQSLKNVGLLEKGGRQNAHLLSCLPKPIEMGAGSAYNIAIVFSLD